MEMARGNFWETRPAIFNAPPQINPFAMAAREATEHQQTEML
jgi:hypothetical protein